MAKRSASGASKAPSKNNKKSSAPALGARQEEARRRGEVRGVLYIAAGILLGVYLFVSGTGVLGEFLSRLLFGLCGWFAYALPLVCIGAGVLSIAGRASGRSGTGWIVTGVIAALTLAEAARGAAYKGSPYLSYLAAAYEAGAAFPHRGGGAVGALLCYPLQQLGGAALAYVVTIAALLIVILMVTRLSLREMSARVNRSVHTAVERVRAEQRRMPVYDLQSGRTSEAGAQEKAPAQPAKRTRRGRRADGDLTDFNAFTADLPVSAADRKVKNVPQSADELTYLNEAELQARPVRKIAPAEAAAQPPEPEPPLPEGDAIWDELEGAEDYPFTLEPVAPAPPAAAAAQETEAPKAPQPGQRKAVVIEHAAPAEEPDVPEIAVEPPPVYVPPSFSLLNAPTVSYGRGLENPAETGKLLIDTLASFNISGKAGQRDRRPRDHAL